MADRPADTHAAARKRKKKEPWWSEIERLRGNLPFEDGSLAAALEELLAALSREQQRREQLTAAARQLVAADDARRAALASGQHSSITRWIPTEQAIEATRAALAAPDPAEKP